MRQETLLNDALHILSYHNEGPDTPIKTLNRLLAKHPHKPFLSPDIQLEHIYIRQEFWVVEDLKVLTVHERARPRNRKPAIIIFEHEEMFYLVDGGNRINKLYQENNTAVHKVYILSLSTTN